ncbi:MAG: hypothetical protein ABFS14_09325 [Gemmatimonadota bacterium]
MGKGWRAAGLALIAVPFLPLPQLFGDILGGRDLIPPSEWLLGVGIFALLAWLLAVATDSLTVPSRLRRIPRAGTFAAPLLLTLLLVMASRVVFEGHPLSIDSIVQLFQAKILAAGSMAAPAPPPGGFFATQHMLVNEAGWSSQYPPGPAAILALGELLGASWLVPIVLSLGTALLLIRFTRRVYGARTATLCAFILPLAPFFWVMGASYMNHVPALFFLALLLNLYEAWERSGSPGLAAASGLALGGAFLARPLTAAAVALPLIAFQLVRPARRRVWSGAVAGAVGFALVASFYLLFNWRTTGEPFLPGYLALWGESHGLGFHVSPWGDLHTPLTGLRNELVDISLLNAFLFEWPIPALLPIGVLFAAGWASERWDRRLLIGLAAIPAAYLFYWHRDGYLGPRFLYSTLVFVIPLSARAVLAIRDQTRSLHIQVGGLFRRITLARYWTVLVLLCALYGALYGAPRRVRAQASSMSSMKADLAATAHEQGIDRGLIFVAVSWGNRLLSRAQGAGVSLSLVQRAYRGIDHCAYQEVLDSAEDADWSADRIGQEFERLLDEKHELVQPAWNLDLSLRVRRDRPLTARCIDELDYDQLGYTIYAPHLLANEPGLTADLVVARDLRQNNQTLRQVYRNRPAFLYRNGRFELLPGQDGPDN